MNKEAHQKHKKLLTTKLPPMQFYSVMINSSISFCGFCLEDIAE